nr:MAG TPA: hypothetical protein [Caudoviricetes sp.]
MHKTASVRGFLFVTGPKGRQPVTDKALRPQ